MNKLIAIVFIFCLSTISFAEEEKHTITMDRGFFTTSYTIDGQESDVNAVEYMLLTVYEANDKWNTGNVLRYVSWGVAGVGGFFVGYGAAQSQSFDEDTVNGYKRTMALGGVIVVAALIVKYIGNSKKDSAIELYNELNGKIISNGSFSFDIIPTEKGGIALALNF